MAWAVRENSVDDSLHFITLHYQNCTHPSRARHERRFLSHFRTLIYIYICLFINVHIFQSEWMNEFVCMFIFLILVFPFFCTAWEFFPLIFHTMSKTRVWLLLFLLSFVISGRGGRMSFKRTIVCKRKRYPKWDNNVTMMTQTCTLLCNTVQQICSVVFASGHHMWGSETRKGFMNFSNFGFVLS